MCFIIERELKNKLLYEIVNGKLLDHIDYLTHGCGVTI